jgi:hypothetical protein
MDYDELSGLMEGIDYIAKTDETSTPFPFYEGRYSTRGNLNLVVYNNDSGKRSLAVSSSSYTSHSAFLNIDQLGELRRLILKGKEILDDPRIVKVRAAPPAASSTTITPAAKSSTPAAAPRPQAAPKMAPLPLNTDPAR